MRILPRSHRGEYFWETRFLCENYYARELTVTSQRKCVVILVANRIGDPQKRITHKYLPR